MNPFHNTRCRVAPLLLTAKGWARWFGGFSGGRTQPLSDVGRGKQMTTWVRAVCLLLLSRQPGRQNLPGAVLAVGCKGSLGMRHVAEGYKTWIGVITEPAVIYRVDVVRVDLTPSVGSL